MSLISSYLGGPADDDDEELTPGQRAYSAATARARALNVSGADGSREPGLLQKVLSPLEMLRGAVYATTTEGVDALTGRGFSTDDWAGKFDRAIHEGEGFGSTEFLSADDDDNFAMRALKGGASFAADVASDPLTYLTLGTATVGKTAATRLVPAVGKKATTTLTSRIASTFGDEAAQELTQKLAGRQAARQGADTTVLRELGADEVVGLAEKRLGDIIMTGRTAGTARTANTFLRDELVELGVENADELATDVIRELGAEVAGGVRLEVPFTRIGTNLTKGGGARGKITGEFVDTANTRRLAARAAMRRPDSVLTRYSGQSGRPYSAMLQDLRADGAGALNNPGATTAATLSDLAASRAAATATRDQVAAVANVATQSVQQAMKDYGDKARANKIVSAAFHNDSLDAALAGLDPADPKVARLIAEGERLREPYQALAEMTGMTIDETYTPRMLTAAEIARNEKQSPAWRRKTKDLDPTEQAEAYTQILLDEDASIADMVAQRIPTPEINRIAGRQVFEEDPLVLLSRYTTSASTRVEAQRLADELVKRGQLVADPRALQLGEVELNDAVVQAMRGAGRTVETTADRAAREGDTAAARVAAAADNAAAAAADGDVIRQNLEGGAAVLRAEVDKFRGELNEAEKAQRVAARRLAALTRPAATAGERVGVAREKAATKLRKARTAARLADERVVAAQTRLNDALAVTAARGDRPVPATVAAGDAAKARQVARTEARAEIAAQHKADVAHTVANPDRTAVDQLLSVRDELVAAGNEAVTDQQVARVAAARFAKDRDRVNAALASARHGTKAERIAADRVEAAAQKAAAVEAKVAANLEAGDTAAQLVTHVNDLLATDDAWETVEGLFRTFYDQAAAAGATPTELARVSTGARAAANLGVVKAQKGQADRLFQSGYQVLGDGKNRNIPHSFEDWMAGRGVTDAINEMYAMAGNPVGVRAALAPYMDSYLRFFKSWATLGRGPGYLARNGIGAMVNNWLSGVPAANMAPAVKASRALMRTLHKLDDDVAKGLVAPSDALKVMDGRLKEALGYKVGAAWGDTTAYDMVSGFLAEGVQNSRFADAMAKAVDGAALDQGLTGSKKLAALRPTAQNARQADEGLGVMREGALRLGEGRLVDNSWINFMSGLAHEQETGVRLAAYLEGFSRWGEQGAAGMFAKSVHFDYGDLTDSERAIKFLVPFYTWTRNNVPYQMRQLLNRPGTFTRLELLSNNLAAAFGAADGTDGALTPEWLDDRFGFGTNFGLPGGATMMVGLESPQLDLLNTFDGGPMKPFSAVLESVNPLIKTAVELGTGKDLNYGSDLEPLGLLGNLAPPLGQARRLVPVEQSSRDRWVTSLASTAIGAPIYTSTERAKEGERHRRVQTIAGRVKDAVAPFLEGDEELDTRWLNEMAETGATPAQIFAALKAGEGRKGVAAGDVTNSPQRLGDLFR